MITTATWQDLEEEKDDFKDWVNHLYGFLHVVHNLFPSYATLANAQISSEEDSDNYSRFLIWRKQGTRVIS